MKNRILSAIFLALLVVNPGFAAHAKKHHVKKKPVTIRASVSVGGAYLSNAFTLGKNKRDEFDYLADPANADSAQKLVNAKNGTTFPGMKSVDDWVFPGAVRLSLDAKKFRAKIGLNGEAAWFNRSYWSGDGFLTLGWNTKKVEIAGTYSLAPYNPVRPTFIEDWRSYPDLNSTTISHYEMMSFRSDKASLSLTLPSFVVNPSLELAATRYNYFSPFNAYDFDLYTATLGIEQNKKLDWGAEISAGLLRALHPVNFNNGTKVLLISCGGYQAGIAAKIAGPVGPVRAGLSLSFTDRVYTAGNAIDAYYNRVDFTGSVTPYAEYKIKKQPITVRLSCNDRFRVVRMPDETLKISKSVTKSYNAAETGLTVRWSPKIQ